MLQIEIRFVLGADWLASNPAIFPAAYSVRPDFSDLEQVKDLDCHFQF